MKRTMSIAFSLLFVFTLFAFSTSIAEEAENVDWHAFSKNLKKALQSQNLGLPTYIYDSYHFAALYSESKEGGPGFKPEEWQWFGHLLVQSGSLNPDVIGPQIAVFVAKEKPFDHLVHHFDEQLARSLFSDDFKNMLELLTLEIDTSGLSEREIRLLTFARETARSLLESGDTA